MLASVITSGFIYLINRKGVDVRAALLAAAYTLALFMVWHLLRVPWLVLKRKENEGLRWWWGLIGACFAAAIAVLIVGTAAWFYTMQPTVNLCGLPDGRDVRIAQLEARLEALNQPEPSNSLRRRTSALSQELQNYLEERQANSPPVAYANSSNPNLSDEQKAKIATYAKYQDETLRYYHSHFMDRLAAVVQEYKAKGVDVRFFEGYTLQNLPFFYASDSPAAAVCDDILCRFRELMYHVDAHDNRIEIP